MKIWKSETGSNISKDSEVVFNFTGNYDLEHYPPKPTPLDLTKPTVMYAPGKGSVANVEGADLNNTSLHHITEDTAAEIDQNFAYSLHNAQQLQRVHTGDSHPNFYMIAHTDNLTTPPEGKKEWSAQGAFTKIPGAEGIVKSRLPFDDYKGSRLKQSLAHSAHPDTFYSHDASLFVRDMLLPAITDDDGALLAKDEVKERFSNLTLIGYSHGSIFCKEVENCLHDKLVEIGQKEDDIKDMLKHVVTINAPSVARVASTKNLFTGYYFEARLDVLRRHVQTPGTQESRGVLGNVGDKLKKELQKDHGEDAQVYQLVEDGNQTAINHEKRLPEPLQNGFTETFKDEHSWKGLEIRDWVKKPKAWKDKVIKNKEIDISNGAIILHDAPNEFVECDSLEQVYAEEPPENAETKENQLHHQIGGILWSHNEEQCIPLLFNRLLQNAIERSNEGGIDFDSDHNHVRAMFTKTPNNDMTPEPMKKPFEEVLNKACMRGGLKPSLQENLVAHGTLNVAGKSTGVEQGAVSSV